MRDVEEVSRRRERERERRAEGTNIKTGGGVRRGLKGNNANIRIVQ